MRRFALHAFCVASRACVHAGRTAVALPAYLGLAKEVPQQPLPCWAPQGGARDIWSAAARARRSAILHGRQPATLRVKGDMYRAPCGSLHTCNPLIGTPCDTRSRRPCRCEKTCTFMLRKGRSACALCALCNRLSAVD